MIRLVLPTTAAALIIVMALVMLWPIHAFAAGRTCGIASWYGTESGNRTANGEYFDGSGITAAHRSLPFGTRLKVTDQATGKSIVVRINDRGPAKWTGRILDLSHAAANRLGIIHRGTARVCFRPS